MWRFTPKKNDSSLLSRVAVQKVLYVIPDLDYRSWTRQVGLLTAHLPRERFEICVASLGKHGSCADSFRGMGIRVESLGSGRWLDPQPALRLRGLVRKFQPDVIHVWGQGCLWAIQPALLGSSVKLIVSDIEPQSPPSWPNRTAHSQLLRRACAVTAANAGGAEALRALGIREDLVYQIPPIVDCNPATPAAGSLAVSVGFPDSTRLVAVVGPLEADKGYRDAVWAFDILHYLVEDLHLIIVGDGQYRARLEDFVESIQARSYIHFAGKLLRVTELLAQTDLVWVISKSGRGINVWLEAMAAGTPVVAPREPISAPPFVSRVSQATIESAERMQLVRESRRLLEDAELRRARVDAGRTICRENYAVEKVLPKWLALYG